MSLVRPPLRKLITLENVDVDAAPSLAFDWQDWGRFTAIAVGIVNKGAAPVIATPEISHDANYVITTGRGVPEPLTILAGEASYDPFGVDLLVVYWRLWLSGDSIVDVHVVGLTRGA
jgi:hypothetical protein